MPQTLTMRAYFLFNSLCSNNRKNTYKSTLQSTQPLAFSLQELLVTHCSRIRDRCDGSRLCLLPLSSARVLISMYSGRMPYVINSSKLAMTSITARITWRDLPSLLPARPLFVLQATKAGRGGLGTRLLISKECICVCLCKLGICTIFRLPDFKNDSAVVFVSIDLCHYVAMATCIH